MAKLKEKNKENGMNVLTNNNNCTGCGTCYLKCPKNAIKMQADLEGFYYPIIDKESCVNCNICRDNCPQINLLSDLTNNKNLFYGGVIISESDLLSSSSGGAFTAVAKALGDDTLFCGAVFSDDLKVVHIVDDDYKVFRKSKYVQSNVTNSFPKVKEHLDSGRRVLFTGTPCQVAGLYSFLGKKYENLITIDLICHGVPSQKVFDSYINSLKKRHKRIKIDRYSFREKHLFWDDWEIGVSYGNNEKTKYHAWGQDPYMFGFLRGLFYRPVCYQCRYSNAGVMRPGDFTIGDFWGSKRVDTRLDEKKGSSVLIVNSNKGFDLIDRISSNMTLIPVNKEDVVIENHNLVTPTPMNPNRTEFFDKLSEGVDFYNIMNKYIKRRSHSQKVRVILSKLFPYLLQRRRSIVRKERSH